MSRGFILNNTFLKIFRHELYKIDYSFVKLIKRFSAPLFKFLLFIFIFFLIKKQ